LSAAAGQGASLALTETPTAAEEAAVRGALHAANHAAGFPRDARPLAVLLRDAAGVVEGGLWGRTAWSWLYVENLVVPPARRGQGLGRRLLAMAEEAATARGCIGARLDTYSFQARGFYEKLGYRVTGRIDDCPPGETRWSMAKRLDAPMPAATPWPDAAAPVATIALTADENDPAAPVALAGLIRHNEGTAPHGHRPINLVVRRAGSAEAVGGLFAFRLYGWVFVRYFYLPEDLRRHGLGAALLRRIEAEAQALGCTGIWLDTFSFQARPFYEKQGYACFATLDDHPPGHARHFMMKRLPGAHGDPSCST
jgi:GNAT superfamily N-acetyltransferase